MKRFLYAHASHPEWAMALALVATQLEAQRADPACGADPTLGWLYLSDHYAADADALYAALKAAWPGVAWTGSVGVGVAAGGVEYFDEPALAVMLGDVPREHFRVYSGVRALGGFDAAVAQVHADPNTPDLAELIGEMAERTRTGYLFGGLAASRTRPLHIADGVWQGGLSGVAYGEPVELISRVTQGCQPIGAQRQITGAERNVVLSLDGEPALDCLLRDLGLASLDERGALTRLRQTLVGLSAPNTAGTQRPGQFGADTLVRHLVGIDPARRAIAIADHATEGMQLAFCDRHADAARRDLVRICSEIREELSPEALPADGEAPVRRIAGAIYVSCSGRGGPHFGAPSAELAIVRHALGDVPLVGFFAAGEIARGNLYGYTGVLTAFLE